MAKKAWQAVGPGARFKTRSMILKTIPCPVNHSNRDTSSPQRNTSFCEKRWAWSGPGVGSGSIPAPGHTLGRATSTLEQLRKAAKGLLVKLYMLGLCTLDTCSRKVSHGDTSPYRADQGDKRKPDRISGRAQGGQKALYRTVSD